MLMKCPICREEYENGDSRGCSSGCIGESMAKMMATIDVAHRILLDENAPSMVRILVGTQLIKWTDAHKELRDMIDHFVEEEE